jgi:hypothetical protein
MYGLRVSEVRLGEFPPSLYRHERAGTAAV